MANQLCGECDGDLKVCEHGRRRRAFGVALGTFILARSHDSGVVDISSLDPDVVSYFFHAGWSWGERYAKTRSECPSCAVALAPDAAHADDCEIEGLLPIGHDPSHQDCDCGADEGT